MDFLDLEGIVEGFLGLRGVGGDLPSELEPYEALPYIPRTFLLLDLAEDLLAWDWGMEGFLG